MSLISKFLKKFICNKCDCGPNTDISTQLTRMENRIMATFEEVVVKLEAVQGELFAVEDRVEAGFDALEILIAELRAAAVDQALVDRAEAVADALRGKVTEFDEDIVPAT